MNNQLINNFIKFDKEIIKQNNDKKTELWFCIRYAVFYNYISKKYFIKRKKSLLESISKLIFQILQTIKLFFFIFKKNKIVEIDTGRYKIYEGKKDSTISYILSKNKINFQTISISSNSRILDNKINVIFLINIIYLFLKIYVKFNKKSYFNLDLIEKEFNIFFKNKKKVDFFNIYNSIYLKQIATCIVIRLFLRLFDTKKILYLETPNLSKLIQYCGKNFIETIDIQHSLISKLNILYRYHVNSKYNYLHTKKIIIWGNYWKKFYSQNSRCISLGHFETIKKLKNIKKNNQIFIVSSIFSRNHLVTLIKFLSKSLSDYSIIYKLRPEEKLTEFKNLINFDIKNIIFLKNISENQLKKTISKSKYVIGINSTLLIESIGLSNVIVYKKGWHQEYEDIIKKKIFMSAKNCNEVLSIIKKNKKIKNKINFNDIFKMPENNVLKKFLN